MSSDSAVDDTMKAARGARRPAPGEYQAISTSVADAARSATTTPIRLWRTASTQENIAAIAPIAHPIRMKSMISEDVDITSMRPPPTTREYSIDIIMPHAIAAEKANVFSGAVWGSVTADLAHT